MMTDMFAFESSVNSNLNFKLLSRWFHLFEHDIDGICKQSIKLRNLGFSSFFQGGSNTILAFYASLMQSIRLILLNKFDLHVQA